MNIKEKPKWLALAVVLILAVAGVTIMIEQEMGSAAVKTGDVSIADRITWAAGFNGTTTKFATLKAVGNTEYVNFTTGFDPTYVVVAAGNPLYDVQGLLNTSDIYQTASISVGKVANGNQAALVSAYALIGVINNGTNMKVESSHAPSNIADNHTLYSSAVNNLGDQFGYNLFNLFASKFTDQQVYTMNLNYTKLANTTSSSVSIAFSDTLSGFGQNLLLTFEVGLFIASGSGILILVWAFPRRS